MKAFFLILFLSLACTQTSAPKKMSDREHDGFIGPVKRVFETWSPIYQTIATVPIGARCRQMTNVYDENGRLIQHSVYPGSCGSDETREDYTYTPDGSRTAHTREIRGKDSPPPPPPAAALHSNSDDERGEPKTVFKYDSAGKLIEESTIRPSGRVIYKYTYSYDSKDQMIEMTGYDDKGKITDRRVYSYSGDDHVPSAFAYYGGDGKMYEKTSYTDYEFNSYGNWIKRKETTEETLNRKSISLEEREIDYYQSGK